MERKTVIVRLGLNLAFASLVVTGCVAPERNVPRIPPSQPMPPRPELQFKEIRCFTPGLSYPISVDQDGNEYVSGDAKNDESCLTPTPQATATPTP